MSNEQQEQPYKVLGEKLRVIRQKLHESVAEVSGAVEIDEQSLVKIEQGHERPSEDILMLLLNHFGLQEDDAANLWELAGYDFEHDPDCDGNHDHPNQREQKETQHNRNMVMVMVIDPRVVYTDGAQVTASQNGVIIGFTQGAGTSNVLTTAKLGMSREQAYSLIHTLQRTLAASEPKQLPNPQDKKDEHTA